MKRLSVFLVFLLIISQFFMFSAKQAFAKWDDEKDLWEVPETFIIKTPKGYYLTRNDLAQNLDYLRSLGFGINKNFVWYSYQTTIKVEDYKTYEWSYFKNGTTFDWITLGGQDGLFEDFVYLNVFIYGDSFLSRVCGNFSRTAQNPIPPKISGYKWNDKNGNGKWDSNEPPLSGWEIKLQKDSETVDKVYTGSDGYYEFKLDAEKLDITPGVFTLSETCPNDWINTCSPGPVKVEEGKPGVNYANNNFGNFKLGKISGYKWDDRDEDGKWDEGEEPLKGWKIILKKPDCSTQVAYTDENGYYNFSGLHYGLHTVSEETRDGWVQTCPGNPDNPSSYDILVESGTDSKNNNFGNFKLGKISGYKWDDGQPPDRQWTEGEKPLAEWIIILTKLTEDGEVVVSETKTDENGAYSFEGLHYGIYRVWEILKDGWRQTTPEKGEATPTNPSYGEGYHEVLVESGTEFEEKNFGNVELGSIKKMVLHFWWLEPIKDIYVRLEELNIPGVLTNIPPLPRDGSTEEDGTITFDSLLPGIYKVKVDLPEPWLSEPLEYEHEVELPEGEDVVVENFIYDNEASEPRTIGFWKNWRLKYTDPEMEALIQRVKTGSQDFSELSIGTIDSMLNTSGKKDKKRMATTQYLGTWLNLASERLGFLPYVNINLVAGWNQIISDDDGILTVHELMLQMRELYNANALSDQEWEIFKNICDGLNNSILLLP